MTAFDLIDSIFSRVQEGMRGNERGISPAQLSFLRDLIEADPEGSAVCRDGPGVTVWMPSGRHKYILREDLTGKRHKLERLSNLASSEAGRLFL